MGEIIFSKKFRLGRFAAQLLIQDWTSDCHFIRALSREPLSLTPPPPRGNGARTTPPPPRPPANKRASPTVRQGPQPQSGVPVNPRGVLPTRDQGQWRGGQTQRATRGPLADTHGGPRLPAVGSADSTGQTPRHRSASENGATVRSGCGGKCKPETPTNRGEYVRVPTSGGRSRQKWSSHGSLIGTRH